MHHQRNYPSIWILVILLIFLFPFNQSQAFSEEGKSVLDWVNEDENGESPSPSPTVQEPIVETNEPNIFMLFVQVIFYTIIIIALIYGLIKFLANRQKSIQRNPIIEMVGGIPLGNQKSLQIIKIGNKVYVLGVADQITLIKELSDEEDLKLIAEAGQKQENIMPRAFSDFLHQKRQLFQEWIQKERENPRNFEGMLRNSLEKQKQRRMEAENQIFQIDREGEGK